MPPLTVGINPDLPFRELLNLYAMNLAPRDLEKTAIIRKYTDLLNVKRLLKEEEIDPRGNLFLSGGVIKARFQF